MHPDWGRRAAGLSIWDRQANGTMCDGEGGCFAPGLEQASF